ncbi:MAG: exodeoxyribonuclease VII small subunit [Pirellulales bacterium]|nr:exodeoxyribonuclease VII small subunit [Pirellulales bacterium]
MPKKKTAKSKQPSFEQSLEQLESIVAKLEGGELGLDESLEQYEAGVKHLKSCYSLLTAAERRIELVSGVDSEGRPRTKPFDDADEESLEQKGASRSRRRSAQSKVDDASSLF